MNFLKQSNLALGLLLCVLIGVMVNVSRGKSSSAPEDNATQDVSSLDRRISLLEQRFYSLESSINRLQQYALSQRTPVQQPSTSNHEINLIREDIQRLSLRLTETECGLLKLDERTTKSVRDTRRNGAAKSADPCRLNPDVPLRLSNRP
jgi:predicted RNase H-like nuclease (RuvC/YqgF family)